MNVKLLNPYSKDEVDVAIKKMAPLKAPGPDGMPPLFYQSLWQNIGSKVSEAVLSCLNSSTLLKSINHTFITLIPKVCNPENVWSLDLSVYVMCFIKLLAKLLLAGSNPFHIL